LAKHALRLIVEQDISFIFILIAEVQWNRITLGLSPCTNIRPKLYRQTSCCATLQL